DCVSLGIVVNESAERFYDEGEDFWPKRYAIWGRLVAAQPNQIAYSIIDAKAIGRFMPPVYPPYRADSLAELAKIVKLDPSALERTVARFNSAVRPGTFDHTVLDELAVGQREEQGHHDREVQREQERHSGGLAPREQRQPARGREPQQQQERDIH